MKEIVIDTNDLFVIKLVHYFITVQNYSPVMVQGANGEVWLENLKDEYKIIRIVTNYLHNNEQLFRDTLKLNRIKKTIKFKTFSFKMKVLNIYTSLGDNVDLSKINDENDNIYIKKSNDLSNPVLLKAFPDIVDKTTHKEDGIELFLKITEELSKNNMKRTEETEETFSKKRPIITYSIMAICIIVYFFMIVNKCDFSSATDFLQYGANIDKLVKSGQYYRLLTSVFVHGGFVHLLLNMYAIYIIGPQIENFYGKGKYLFIYLFSGICGSLLSISFNPNTVTLGASGAIFGLLGAMLYFGYHYRTFLGNAIRSQIIPIILINLIIGFTMTGIDNAGHIGGLIGGIVAAIAVGVKHKSSKAEKINGWIILTILFSFLVYLAMFYH
ncbi:MAG: rhomboid family intramembrane serine protease [bacterium]|nr:rhomboid family intramembrane serine protease [bacterium]